MTNIAVLISISVFVVGVLTSAMATLAMRAQRRRENASPYECGFDPNNSARTPFSLRFFLLGIIFLIFDVEIALLFPLPLVAQDITGVGTTVVFLLILVGGLAHEWREGSLEWA